MSGLICDGSLFRSVVAAISPLEPYSTDSFQTEEIKGTEDHFDSCYKTVQYLS
jgi:hypothetical protein